MKKEEVFIFLDRTIVVFLCLSIFCLPFSKAGIESFVWPAIFIFLLKRVLGYRGNAFLGLLPKTGLNKALGIFIAINALSVVFSTNLGLSLRAFFGKELKFLMIYFMLVEVISSRKRLKVFLSTIFLSVILILVDSAVQYFRGVDFLRGYDWARLRASFITANCYAAWLIVFIPLFLGLSAAGRNIGRNLRILVSILILPLVACLILTYSRGGWIGFIAGISFMSGFVFKKFTLKIKLLSLFVVLGLLSLFLFLPQPIKERVKSIGRIDFKVGLTLNERLKSTLNMEEGAILIRLNFWKESLRMIKDYYIVGCGLNTYSIVARDYKSFAEGGTYPHNSYLQMAAETGLSGLFAFFWVLFVFFKTGIDYFNRSKDYLVLGLLSGILAFLAHAFFDNHLYSLQLVVLFWYMLGLTMVVVKLDLKNSGGSN